MANTIEYLIKRVVQLERDVERIKTAEGGVGDSYLPIVMFASLGSGITTTLSLAGAVIPRNPTHINRFWVSCRVATTNNGSNYWTASLLTLPSGATVSTANTSADAANTWMQIRGVAVSYNTVPGDVAVYVSVAPTGAPGALSVLGIIINVT